MRRACMVPVCLLWLVAAAQAGAQEPQPPARPPATVPQLRPPPPQWAPCCAAPVPSLAEIDALEQAGRRHKRVGAILLGTGGGIALVGVGLAIGGAWDEHECGWYDDYDYRYYHHHHGCGASALSIAGATTTLLGIGVIIPGIVEYVSGGGEVARARHLRRYYWGVASLRPAVTRDGARLTLVISR